MKPKHYQHSYSRLFTFFHPSIKYCYFSCSKNKNDNIHQSEVRSKLSVNLLHNCVKSEYCLGLEYRVTSRIILYFVVPRISIPKSDQSDNWII